MRSGSTALGGLFALLWGVLSHAACSGSESPAPAGQGGGEVGDPSASTTGGDPPGIHCAPLLVPGECICGPDVSDGTQAECSEAAFPDTICCAGPGYPESGSCTCERWGCSKESASCLCSLHRDDPYSTCPAPAGWTCCADYSLGQLTSCSCTTVFDECLASQVQVAGCSFEDVACPEGRTRVDSCRP